MNRESVYKTKQREILLNYLVENKDKHLTIDNIVTYLRENNEVIGQTTVYRYLNMLLEQGTVRKYIIDEKEAACFQYIGKNKECNEHYHLKCDKCKEVFHMDCNVFKDIGRHLQKEHSFAINNSKIVLYGTCEKCSKK